MLETTEKASYYGRGDLSGEGGEKREGKIGGWMEGEREREMGLTGEGLRLLKQVYEIGEEVGARLLEPGETVMSPREGYVAVYEWQVRNGLKFPVEGLLREVIREYQISISQIYPLGICRVITFEICYEKARIYGSVKLFRHFYYIKKAAEGYYFSCRPKRRTL